MITWKILEIKGEAPKIESVRYFAAITEGELKVETEGNCNLSHIEIETPWPEVTEEQIAGFVKKEFTKDGINLIELRLQEQLETLKNQGAITPPWVKAVFKPTL